MRIQFMKPLHDAIIRATSDNIVVVPFCVSVNWFHVRMNAKVFNDSVSMQASEHKQELWTPYWYRSQSPQHSPSPVKAVNNACTSDRLRYTAYCVPLMSWMVNGVSLRTVETIWACNMWTLDGTAESRTNTTNVQVKQSCAAWPETAHQRSTWS